MPALAGAGEVVAGQGVAAGPDGVQHVALGPVAARGRLGRSRSPSTPRHSRPASGSAPPRAAGSFQAEPRRLRPAHQPAEGAGHGRPGRLLGPDGDRWAGTGLGWRHHPAPRSVRVTPQGGQASPSGQRQVVGQAGPGSPGQISRKAHHAAASGDWGHAPSLPVAFASLDPVAAAVRRPPRTAPSHRLGISPPSHEACCGRWRHDGPEGRRVPTESRRAG